MEIISREIEEYCEAHTTPESRILSEINRDTHLSQVYPRMLSGHLQGTFLRMFSMLLKPSRILEIGTFTGYSAVCLASGLDEHGMLHTIDVDPELEYTIRQNIDKAGLTQKITVHIGEAEKIIPKLKEKWDLVFIDADKPNYLKYYRMILPFVRSGGYILADNALWDGKVLEGPSAGRDAAGISEFNDFVQKDPSVENLLLPFRDGVMIVRKL